MNRGPDAGCFLETPTRLKIDLSGPWDYFVEGGPSGKVRVPCSYDFVGKVTFDRTVPISAEIADKYQFHIVGLGINHFSEVSWNGEFITSHAGGYTGFIQGIPRSAVQPGENNLRVVVQNSLDARKTLPLLPQVWGWRNYGGITRDIFLLGTPFFFIRDASVQTDLSDNQSFAKIIVKPTFEGVVPTAGAPAFYFEVLERLSGLSVGRSALVSLVRKGEEWGETQADLPLANPKVWSPEVPDLYLVKCYLVNVIGKDVTLLDEYDLTAGIRKLQLSKGDILLNGKRVILRGVTWYEDHPTWGASITPEERERDMVLIKNLGANVVRFGGHPPDPCMLSLCDRYGLLAMEDLPIANAPGRVLGEESFAELAAASMREMVVRDRNHPSVLAWGLGDEFESSKTGVRSFVEGLTRLAKSLDTRPVYYASRMPETDVCSDLVDIAALNVYTQDLKTFKTLLEGWRDKHRSQPVIVSKFGTEVQQNNRNGYSDLLSQQAQALFYLQRLDVVRSLDLDGAIVWSFNDWRGDRPALTVNNIDPWEHSMGLVSARRERRLAYEAVRSVFRGEKFGVLQMGNHTTGSPIVYVLAGFAVLLGMAYYYNASRRFRDNLNRSVLNSYNFFADVRDQHVVSIVHSTILGVVVSLATAIVVSSILYHFRESWMLDNLLSSLLVFDSLKATVVRLILNPLLFIGYFSAVLFLGLLSLSGFIMLLRVFFKARIYPFHAYSVTMWSTPPLLILIPIGMVLYRVMESPVYVIPTLVVFAALLGWVFIRWLKGVSIIFDVVPVKMYLVGLLFFMSACALLYFYYDISQSMPMYIAYMYDVMAGSP